MTWTVCKTHGSWGYNLMYGGSVVKNMVLMYDGVRRRITPRVPEASVRAGISIIRPVFKLAIAIPPEALVECELSMQDAP